MKTLTLESIKADALAAYKANRLSAQHPTQAAYGKLVSKTPDGYCTCGIGASIEPAYYAQSMDGRCSWIPHSSPNLGLAYDLEHDISALLSQVSNLHDAWHTHAYNNTPSAKDAEAEFLALIMTPTLTIQSLKANALRAYNENRLTAQHANEPDLQRAGGYLIHGKFCCAAGASIPAPAEDKNQCGGFDSLCHHLNLKPHDQTLEVELFVGRLINHHDAWFRDQSPRSEARFLELIQ